MPKTFVITEIWTRSRVVTAANKSAALEQNEPQVLRQLVAPDAAELDENGTFELDVVKDLDFNLSNWHVTEVPDGGH